MLRRSTLTHNVAPGCDRAREVSQRTTPLEATTSQRACAVRAKVLTTNDRYANTQKQNQTKQSKGPQKQQS